VSITRMCEGEAVMSAMTTTQGLVTELGVFKKLKTCCVLRSSDAAAGKWFQLISGCSIFPLVCSGCSVRLGQREFANEESFMDRE